MARSVLARHSLRLSFTTQEPRVCGGCNHNPRTRDRREHGDFQRRLCRTPEAASIPEPEQIYSVEVVIPERREPIREPASCSPGLSGVAQSRYRFRGDERSESVGMQSDR